MFPYTVVAGDTLYGIAQTYLGDGNLYPQIMAVNPQITDPDVISVGQVIQIPGSTPAATIPGTPIPLTPAAASAPAKASLNTTVMVGALLVGVIAAGYWWMQGARPKAQANPEEIEDEEIEGTEEVQDEE